MYIKNLGKIGALFDNLLEATALVKLEKKTVSGEKNAVYLL